GLSRPARAARLGIAARLAHGRFARNRIRRTGGFHMVRLARCLALICAPAFIFSHAAAQAAPKRARLTIEVKAEGTEKVIGSGSDQSSATFREGYTLVTYLKAEGELEQFNTKDPEYAQKMMGMAANVNAKAAQAQGRAPAKKMSPEEM